MKKLVLHNMIDLLRRYENERSDAQELYDIIDSLRKYENFYEAWAFQVKKAQKRELRIVFDVKTTGPWSFEDEILRLSVINADDGSTIYNQYFKPRMKTSWEKAQTVNRIPLEILADSPYIIDCIEEIQKILLCSNEIICYGILSAVDIMDKAGIILDEDDNRIIDVMEKFSPIYGEWWYDYNKYKPQELSVCAKYYGYAWDNNDACNDLANCRAILFCYQQMKAKNQM